MKKSAARSTKKPTVKKATRSTKKESAPIKKPAPKPAAVIREVKTQEDQGFDPVVILLIVILIGVAIYTLVRGNMSSPGTKSPSTPIVSPTSQPTTLLRNSSWRWVSTRTADGKESRVTATAPFTVTFNESGMAALGTDCNSGSASYTETSGSLVTIGDILSTKMYCEGSKEIEYFDRLRQVTKFSITDQQLLLMTSSDSGTLVFEKVQ